MDMLEYWLEQGADGFRIDAINHLYEVENFADEPMLDQNGNKTDYNNYNHTSTMNQVS